MGHGQAHRQHYSEEPPAHEDTPQSVSFSDEEAGTIMVAPDAASDAGVPAAPINHELVVQTFGHYAEPTTIGPANDDGGESLAHQVVSDGVTKSEEHRPAEDAAALKQEGGENVSEDVEHTGEVLELEGGGGIGVRTAAQIARIPYVIELVKQHKYPEAIKYITGTLGFSDATEVIKLVAEHFGLEKVAGAMGAATDVIETGSLVLEGLTFQYEGLEAIAEAHERGDRDNRIELYSEAWAAGFLAGSYSNAGAITDEQRKAVADGVREGKASAGALGQNAADTAKKLLAQYGSEDNARHALIDELLERAGVDGIKTHEGT